MPARITINWQEKRITYWWPWSVVELRVKAFASMYDCLTLAMANGYRQDSTFSNQGITLLENDPYRL